MLRNVGCICKRKFLNDVNIVRQISYSLKTNKYICALYPEARYSHVGTTAILPISLAKMVKILGFPVVTLICHGNHLRQPVWNLGYKRKVDITADMTYLFDENEIKDLSIEEINNKIQKAFNYNDYQYQLDNNILIKEEIRALGLERVLYKCPHCHNEESMKSTGTTIYCEKCEKEYVLMENGNLRCINGETLFNNIPAWYEWERECVKKEVEDGTYSVNVEVDADDLRNSKGFYRFGRGILNHNLNGFYFHANVDNEDFVLTKSPLENYSAHVEYAYFGRGDAISFSTKDDSYYFFPVDNRNIVTKLHFGVEEVFKYTKNKMNNKDE